MLWVLTVRKRRQEPFSLRANGGRVGRANDGIAYGRPHRVPVGQVCPTPGAASFLSVFLVLSFADISYPFPLVEPIILSHLFLPTSTETPWRLFSKNRYWVFRHCHFTKTLNEFNDFPSYRLYEFQYMKCTFARKFVRFMRDIEFCCSCNYCFVSRWNILITWHAIESPEGAIR